MSRAAETRRRVREQPFLYAALRAGVVNYRAAADFLDVEGDAETIATALRRYAEELPPYETEARDVRVRMRSGLGLRDRTATGGPNADATDDRDESTEPATGIDAGIETEPAGVTETGIGDEADPEAGGETGTEAAIQFGDEPFLSVGGRELVPGGGSLTAVTAGGEVDAKLLSTVLDRLETAGVVVDAAGVAGDALVVVVPGRQGATALQIVEAVATAVPAASRGHNR